MFSPIPACHLSTYPDGLTSFGNLGRGLEVRSQGFRVQSLGFRQSVGDWELRVSASRGLGFGVVTSGIIVAGQEKAAEAALTLRGTL